MLITNINSSIFLKNFTSFFNYNTNLIINTLFRILLLHKLLINYNVNFNIIINICKKKQTLNKEKQASIMFEEKSTKKENNNANLKFVDQLILKKKNKNIANQNQELENFDCYFFVKLDYKYKNRLQDVIAH